MNRLIILLSLLLPGCLGNDQAHNLTAHFGSIEPIKSVIATPGLDWGQYRTFSVLPISKAVESSSLKSGPLEQHMMFVARNHMEGRGYSFVTPGDGTDLVLFVDANAPYKTSYVPPSTITVPRWVPGKTITSTTNTSGSVNLYGNFNTFGNLNTFGNFNTFGTVSGTSNTSTYVPGYATTETHHTPGYTVGYYYPTIDVYLLDAKTWEIVWQATATGSTQTQDIRISSFQLFLNTLSEIPYCSHCSDLTARLVKMGWGGFDYEITTLDGNNYFPAVMGFGENSPAKKAGLKNYDIITAINGRATKNLSAHQVFDLLDSTPGQMQTLTLYRMGNLKIVEFELAPTSIALSTNR